MGHVLFWLEAAATSTLYVAMWIAILARIWGRKWPAWGFLLAPLPLLLAVSAPLPWILTIVTLAGMEASAGGALFPLVCSSVTGGLFLIAAVAVIRRGRRRAEPGGPRQAARWRLDRLALAWAGGLLLTLMTYWNLSLAVRQSMAVVRTEAGAVALSAAPPGVLDSQNAFLVYRQASEILDARLDAQKANDHDWTTLVGNWTNLPEEQFDPGDEALQEFLRRQAPVIDLLHRAGGMAGFSLGYEYSPPSIKSVLPSIGHLRSLCRLLCLSARVNAHQGRMSEAFDDLRASFSLADHCATESLLIVTLVACAADALAAQTLEAVLAETAPTADNLDALELRAHLDFNRALHRSMRMERAFGLSVFADALRFGIAEIGAGAVRGPSSASLSIASGLQEPYGVFLWQQDVKAYDGWMQRTENLSSRPYFAARQAWQETENLQRRQGFGGILAGILTPSLQRAAEIAATTDARHRLALLAVAMWRHRLDHGAFPAELSLLAPEHLPVPLVDPFTGQAMKLAKTPDGRTVVYSVGPDLIDNGGEPLDERTQTGDVSLILEKSAS